MKYGCTPEQLEAEQAAGRAAVAKADIKWQREYKRQLEWEERQRELELQRWVRAAITQVRRQVLWPNGGNSYHEDLAPYRHARKEHAWLLRAEGLTYREIGKRLGVCTGRASDLVWMFSRRVARAMKKTKVSFEFGKEPSVECSSTTAT